MGWTRRRTTSQLKLDLKPKPNPQLRLSLKLGLNTEPTTETEPETETGTEVKPQTGPVTKSGAHKNLASAATVFLILSNMYFI